MGGGTWEGLRPKAGQRGRLLGGKESSARTKEGARRRAAPDRECRSRILLLLALVADGKGAVVWERGDNGLELLVLDPSPLGPSTGRDICGEVGGLKR